MLRAAVIACWPWFLALLGAVVALRTLMWLCGAKAQWGRLRKLHSEQTGGVQSLAFVLAAPVFIMVLMLIVQISQVMVAQVVINYAAFATARAAVVWIPASVGWQEGVQSFSEGPNEIHWVEPTGFRDGHPTSRIVPGDRKYNKIKEAAILACLPIAPSKSQSGDQPLTSLGDTITRMYQTYAPATESNTKVPVRLANKLAYSLEFTDIEIETISPTYYDDLGRLVGDDWGDDWGDWWDSWNHVGWRDQITVTVKHEYALLPGPARLLAKQLYPGNETASRIHQNGPYYAISISATATLGNEGEKSSWPHNQPETATNWGGVP